MQISETHKAHIRIKVYNPQPHKPALIRIISFFSKKEYILALHIMKFVIPGEIWNPRKVSHYAGLLPSAGCREGGCNKIVLNMQVAAAAAMDHIFTAQRKYTAMRVLAKSVPIHFAAFVQVWSSAWFRSGIHRNLFMQ